MEGRSGGKLGVERFIEDALLMSGSIGLVVMSTAAVVLVTTAARPSKLFEGTAAASLVCTAATIRVAVDLAASPDASTLLASWTSVGVPLIANTISTTVVSRWRLWSRRRRAEVSTFPKIYNIKGHEWLHVSSFQLGHHFLTVIMVTIRARSYGLARYTPHRN